MHYTPPYLLPIIHPFTLHLSALLEYVNISVGRAITVVQASVRPSVKPLLPTSSWQEPFGGFMPNLGKSCRAKFHQIFVWRCLGLLLQSYCYGAGFPRPLTRSSFLKNASCIEAKMLRKTIHSPYIFFIFMGPYGSENLISLLFFQQISSTKH